MTTIAAAAADVDVDAEVTDAEMQRCRFRCRIGSHPKIILLNPKKSKPGSLSLFRPTKICLQASN